MTRAVAVLSLMALAVAAGGCVTEGPERDPDGAIEEPGSISVQQLEVGDCFDDPEGFEMGSGEAVLSLPAVPCDEPHDNEVFAVLTLDDGSYPGRDALLEEGVERCLPEYEAYVGAPYGEGALDYDPYLVPTEESWDDGDREIVCALYDAELAPLSGSMAGTGR